VKPVLINQPAQAGDILFTQKIAAHYAAAGHEVVQPIADRYAWVREGLTLPDNVSMPLISESYPLKPLFTKFENGNQSKPVELDEAIVLQLHNSWIFDPSHTMGIKYDVARVPMADWVDYVDLKRNKKREQELFSKVLKLTNKSSFTLVNEHSSNKSIPIPAPQPAIYMRPVPGYSLLDWCTVIERAERIITIDTSLVLLAEILKVKAKLHMVSRFNQPTFVHLAHVLRLPWQLAPRVENLRLS
jgi:hypothetical protein